MKNEGPAKTGADEVDGKPKRRRKVRLTPEDAERVNLDARFNLSFADLRTDGAEPSSIERDPKVFRKNLRFLIKVKGMSKATVAKEAKVREDWLRKVMWGGLKQIRPRSKASLDRLRRFFSLDSVDELWSETLIDSLKQTECRAARIQPCLRSKHWPCIDKFLYLLQSGDYDFVGELVGKLYEQKTALEGRSSHNKEEKASAKDLAEYRRSRLGGG